MRSGTGAGAKDWGQIDPDAQKKENARVYEEEKKRFQSAVVEALVIAHEERTGEKITPFDPVIRNQVSKCMKTPNIQALIKDAVRIRLAQAKLETIPSGSQFMKPKPLHQSGQVEADAENTKKDAALVLTKK